jgi:dihydrofolate reductase
MEKLTKRRMTMGQVVVSQFISLDGVVEDPGGAEGFDRGGWAFDLGPEGAQFKLDEAKASEALLLGRVTYEGFAKAWPSRTGEFADKFNAMPKYVVSTTLKEPEWNNSAVIDGDVAKAVAELKRDADGDILINGKVQLVQTLMVHDLFGETCEAVTLRLVDAKPAGEILIYEPSAKEPENA